MLINALGTTRTPYQRNIVIHDKIVQMRLIFIKGESKTFTTVWCVIHEF